MWIVMRDYGWRIEVRGPFPTAARASGWGFSQYGPSGLGARWHVRKVTP